MFLGLVVGRQPGTFPPLGKSGGVRADGPRWTLVDLVDLKDLVAFARGLGAGASRCTREGRAPMPFGWTRSTRSTKCM